MKLGRLVFPLFVLGVVLAPATARSAAVGEVAAVRGQAVLVRGGESLDVTVHLAVLVQDEIRTGPDGRVKILFSDDSLVTIGKDTSSRVAEFVEGSGETKGASLFNLVSGTIRSVVGRNALTVKTPTALAAARGTEFFTRASEEMSEVVVTENRVWVRNVDPTLGEEVEVPEGFFVRVLKGQPPLDPERFTRDLLDSLRDATDVRISPLMEGQWTQGNRFQGLPRGLGNFEDMAGWDLIQQLLDQDPVAEVPVNITIELPER